MGNIGVIYSDEGEEEAILSAHVCILTQMQMLLILLFLSCDLLAPLDKASFP